MSGYASNNHGLLGGIDGDSAVCRVSFKPTIALTQQSVRKDFTEIDFELRKDATIPAWAHEPASRQNLVWL